MTMSFQVTKFEPPARRTSAVARSSITGLLARERRQLVLIAAPAGFGKTSVAAQWYSILRDGGEATCWISLAREECDLFRFLNLVIEATHRELPAVGGYASKILASNADTPWPPVVASLIEDLMAHGRSITLFLDDYHLIETPAINAVVESLLFDAPRHVSLVITTRDIPTFGLAALKVRDVLTEITLEELKFSLDETEKFTAAIHELHLAPEDLRLLQEKTEGWAAGLQLAALALKKGGRGREFIQALAGNFRDVSDYLFSDVLSQQEPAIQTFLLRTSVLDRLSAPLCAAIISELPAQELLERIECANLFLVGLDHSRRWYRYHPLFREFLRSKLISIDAPLATRLTISAARYCALNGLPEEAVRYALAADSFDYAASLVEDHALSMIYLGEVPQLISWLHSIPEHVVTSHPRLLAFHCWALFHRGRATEIQDMLRRTEAAGVAVSDDARAREIESAVLRVAVLVSSDRFEDTCIQGLLLADKIGEQPFLAGVLQNFIGIASYGLADIHQARRAAHAAHRLLTIARCPYGVVYAGCIETLCELTLGDVSAARRIITDTHHRALANSGPRSFCAAFTACLMGVVAYHEANFDEAQPLLAENLPLIRDCVNLEVQRVATVALCRLHAIQGDFDSAHGVLDVLERTTHADLEACARVVVARERVRLYIRSGSLKRAQQIWQGLALIDTRTSPRPRIWHRIHGELDLLEARWSIAQARYDEAESILAGLAGALTGDGCRPQRREIAVLRATALQRQRKLSAAQWILAQQFGHDPPGTTPLPLIEAGAELIALWRAAQEAIPTARVGDTPLCNAVTPAGGKSEFSARELDVLRLAATGKKNSRIAAELAISENTVKWHMRNIMEKFGVPNRISAVVAARESGLIN